MSCCGDKLSGGQVVAFITWDKLSRDKLSREVVAGRVVAGRVVAGRVAVVPFYPYVGP
jgi:hypothetical protein